MANTTASFSGVGRSRSGPPRGWPLLGLGLCAALLTGSMPLGAQSDDENARRHFESGAAYLQQSDYDSALREFQAAYALSKRPPLLLNIANVYERMGKLPEAVDALSRYLEEDPKSPERTTHETRIANLKKRIDAMPPPSPAASASATAPTASNAPLPPSAPTAAPTAQPRPEPPPASGSSRAPAFIAFGVGGAAAVGAVVTGLFAKGKYDDADKQCKPSCSDSTVNSIKSMAIVSDVLTGVAAIGVGFGAILLLTSAGSHEAASGRKPSIAAGVGPRGGSLEATWRF